MKSTFKIYKEIYPEKELSYPKVLDIIKQIVKCYDKLKLENRIINVYLFTTPHNFVETEYYDSEMPDLSEKHFVSLKELLFIRPQIVKIFIT